jgi:hypothetical protein
VNGVVYGPVNGHVYGPVNGHVDGPVNGVEFGVGLNLSLTEGFYTVIFLRVA